MTLDERVIRMFEAHGELMKTHTKALACHCECLGMDAENSLAICQDRSIPYADRNYFQIMYKWGLTDEKGESII